MEIFDGCCYESKSRRPSLPSRLPKTGRVDGGPRVYGQQELVDILNGCCDESKSRRPSLPPRLPKTGRADGGPWVYASRSSWTSSTAAAPPRSCSRSSGTSSTPPLSGERADAAPLGSRRQRGGRLDSVGVLSLRGRKASLAVSSGSCRAARGDDSEGQAARAGGTRWPRSTQGRFHSALCETHRHLHKGSRQGLCWAGNEKFMHNPWSGEELLKSTPRLGVPTVGQRST